MLLQGQVPVFNGKALRVGIRNLMYPLVELVFQKAVVPLHIHSMSKMYLVQAHVEVLIRNSVACPTKPQTDRTVPQIILKLQMIPAQRDCK